MRRPVHPGLADVLLLRCAQCHLPMARVLVSGEQLITVDEVVSHAYFTMRATHNRWCLCGRRLPEMVELRSHISRWFARGLFMEPFGAGDTHGALTVRW
jgi:hypothetical protein